MIRFPAVPEGSGLALFADFLQVAVDAGLRNSECGGGAGDGALKHEHTVAVEVANNVHTIGLPKRGDILPAAFEQLGNAAVDELLCGLRKAFDLNRGGLRARRCPLPGGAAPLCRPRPRAPAGVGVLADVGGAAVGLQRGGRGLR